MASPADKQTPSSAVLSRIGSSCQRNRVRCYAHPETRIDSPFGPMIFCTDPYGVRIELIQRAS